MIPRLLRSGPVADMSGDGCPIPYSGEPLWLLAYLVEHSRATLSPVLFAGAALTLALAPFHEVGVLLFAGALALLALGEALRRAPSNWVVGVGTLAGLVPALIGLTLVFLTGEIS